MGRQQNRAERRETADVEPREKAGSEKECDNSEERDNQEEPNNQEERNNQEALSRYAQSLKRESKGQSNAPADDGADSSKCVLVKVDFFDSTKEPPVTVSETETNEGKNVKLTTDDGKTKEIQFDKNGQVTKFTNTDGEVFERQSVGEGEEPVWRNKANFVQPDGVSISVDESYNVKMVDKATQNTVTYSRNGLETTDYAGGGRTVRKGSGNEEWIVVESVNQPMRAMRIVDNKLVSYTDSEGNTFTKTERLTPYDPKNPYSQKPIFEVTGPSTKPCGGNYTITADRSGNVVVRNEDQPDSRDYARRELVNGTVIASDSKPTWRQVKRADGLSVTAEFDDRKRLLKKSISYPNGGNLALEYDKMSGELISVKGTAGGKDVWYEKHLTSYTWSDKDGNRFDANAFVIEEKNAQIVIGTENGQREVITQSGTVVSTSDCVQDAPDIDEAPRVIAKTPPDVDVQANIRLARQHSVAWLDGGLFEPYLGRIIDNSKWFHKQVNYGGAWDYKSPRSSVPGNDDVKINDQMYMAEYEVFGNWHYGMVGRAAGFSQTVLEREAGVGQVKIGTSKPEWGDPGVTIYEGVRLGGTGTYGDDPEDNRWIKQGYADQPQVESRQAA